MLEALRELVGWMRRSRRYSGYPLIRRSRVEDLTGISDSAQVNMSVLKGRVLLESGAILDACEIVANQRVAIGRNSILTGPIRIVSDLNPVSIGRYCSIAPHASMWESSHRHKRISTYFIASHVLGGSYREDLTSRGPVCIGNDVWIGTRAVILSGVEVGDGAIVGAGAVVTSDIPAYSVAVGAPARVVKHRFTPEIRERLLKLEWWSWSEERIKANEALFREDLTVELLDSIQ